MAANDHRRFVATSTDELLCVLIEEIQGLRAELQATSRQAPTETGKALAKAVNASAKSGTRSRARTNK